MNLIYNYARDYDAQTGRYVESDPIALMGGTNTYGYARGIPVANVDPLGLYACGPAGDWKRFIVPDYVGIVIPFLPPAIVSIAPVCIEHDKCYDTCGSSKGGCDLKFDENLRRQCNFTGAVYPVCRLVALAYSKGIRGDIAQEQYDKAQAKCKNCGK